MSGVADFSLKILRERHGLSSFQIKKLTGTKESTERFEDKIDALEKVAEFIRITDALNSESIEFIPLKGPVLSYCLYGDATVREYCDLDLLVGLPFVYGTIDLLTGLGYEPLGYQFPRSQIGQQIVIAHLHHVLFVHKSHNLRVELHWRLFQTPPVKFRKLNKVVVANLSEITFADRSFKVLSRELEFLYLVMHGSLHYWRRLKWLTDINEYLKVYKIDWEEFRAMAFELRASRLISLANYVLPEFYPSGPSIPWKNDRIPFMRAYALKQIYSVEESERETLGMKISRLRFSFHCYPGIMYKIRRLGSVVVFYFYHAFKKREHSAI